MLSTVAKPVFTKVHDSLFRAVHSKWLIYNTCWEDPRIDRQLLGLAADSRVVMITSAGCNALDYLLDDAQEIHAVDVNPRQNALLDLKLALLGRGDFDDLYAMFGRGAHRAFHGVYQQLRPELPPYAQAFWDAKIAYFDHHSPKRSFYYYGASGAVAWIFSRYLMTFKKSVRDTLFDLIDAQTLSEQQEIYERVEPKLWGKLTAWFVQQPAVLAMQGVPRAQIDLIRREYPGGVAGYVKDKLRHVLTQVLVSDNYFWRVYLKGSYTPDCCPNYLRPEHFTMLRERRDRVHTHNSTLATFLRQNPGEYTHFVLLDHQDWLAWYHPEALREEWELILRNSRPGARVIMRSAAADVSFLPDIARVALRFFPDRTEPLHQQCRVGTYASLHFAEVV